MGPTDCGRTAIGAGRGSQGSSRVRKAKTAMVLVSSALVLQSCGWVEGMGREECVRYEFRVMPIAYCAKFANGYCQQTAYRPNSGNVCVETACKPEYVAYGGRCLTNEEYLRAAASKTGGDQQ